MEVVCFKGSVGLEKEGEREGEGEGEGEEGEALKKWKRLDLEKQGKNSTNKSHRGPPA